MKKTLLGAALFLATGISAQTYFEDDFSSGLATNWNLFDEDGDGNDWATFDDTQSPQGMVATSASWNNTAGALNPDNWMVTNAIDLTGASGSTELTWVAKGQDQSYPAEEYAVYVGTSNDINDMIAAGDVFNEVMTATNDAYVARSVDVDGFNGQTIYVAFRHYNTSDQFRINIDDVKVSAPLSDDLALSSISVDNLIMGDRDFTVTVKNNGLNAATAFDVEYSFDGGATMTENVTGVNLATGQTHSFTVSETGVTEGPKVFTAEITTSDEDASNNSASETFEFVVPVPQYLANDSDGNSFDLHQRLSDGQAIILDFMASWCTPCESSTPALSELVENNGSGQGNLEALAITVESTDDAAVLNGLNWNGGFYSYPKFPYTVANNNAYYHYAVSHGLNSEGYIPFFVMICPDVNNPEMSSIVKADAGYGQGMFAAYQTALDQCPTATLDVIEMPETKIDVNVYPNPANSVVNVEFNLNNQENVTVSVVNTVGQTVVSNNLGAVSGIQSTQLDVSALESGMYIVKVASENGEQTKRISVIK